MIQHEANLFLLQGTPYQNQLFSFVQENLVGTQTVPTIGSSVSVLDVPGLDICTRYWFIARAATCAAEAFSEPSRVELRDTDTFEFIFNLFDDEGSCSDWIKVATMDKINAIETTLKAVLDSTVCGFIQVGCFDSSTFRCSDTEGKTVKFG